MTHEPLRITYESHDQKIVVELPWGSDLSSVVRSFAGILVQAGFSYEGVGEVITSDGLPVWEWNVT